MVRAITINCTLQRAQATASKPSSTARLLGEVEAQWRKLGVEVLPSIRAADLNLLPGTTSDEGPAMTGQRCAAA